MGMAARRMAFSDAKSQQRPEDFWLVTGTEPRSSEKAIGFKRFSDVMKQLEKEHMVVVEMDEQKTMLVKLL